jgi:outer membrane lipoprotein LolB
MSGRPYREQGTGCAGGLILLAALLLGSCATQRPVEPLMGDAWKSRQTALTALRDWSLSGRISVTKESEGWHASLRWEQTRQGYSIDLRNPLGQTVARIEGNEQGVQVRTSDGEIRSASDPDQLVEETLGLRIPVKGLQYWLRGVPDPASPSTLAGDTEGHLTRLEQDGWVIEYPSYTQAAGLDLPARIRARQEQLKVQLVVNQWDVTL